ncbi:hypothetical protein C7M84_008713 [Penaeus vannamei]|uniref:Gustatory receptor n=1 Tax=Penaeus vannamei TaxID=6689 RepID=A0A3R7PPA1_PENVA|nr:hypothetical protein C7M84_008713 [Penaeus vannamei]
MVVEHSFRGSRQLRILFVAIALLGFFPYWCRKNICNPIFSMKLLLWDIFVQLFLICGNYLQTAKVFLSLVTQDVGGWAFGISLILAGTCQVVTPILVMLRSKRLVSMLRDLPAVLEEEREKGLNWEATDIAFLVLMACLVVFSAVYFSLVGTLVVAEIIYLIVYSVFVFLSMGCVIVLFRKLPRLLTQQVQRRVEDAVVACIEGSLDDSRAEGREEDLAPLHTLEQEVRKNLTKSSFAKIQTIVVVSLQLSNVRGKVVRSFFLSVTALITVCIGLAIAMSYASFRGFLVNGGTVLLFFVGLSLIYFFYNVGQSCNDQVNDAVETLQNLSCNFASADAKAQVYHVITCLQPLRKFDMCGWYTLDYPSLVTAASVVVTYLVILLQVGGLQLQN